MRLNSVRDYTQNPTERQDNSILPISKMGEESVKSVTIVEPNDTKFKNDKSGLKKANKRLKNEVTMLKDEKCILINKIFSLSKKLEHLKHVSRRT